VKGSQFRKLFTEPFFESPLYLLATCHVLSGALHVVVFQHDTYSIAVNIDDEGEELVDRFDEARFGLGLRFVALE